MVELQRQSNGDWLCNLANTAAVLRSDPDYRGLFACDSAAPRRRRLRLKRAWRNFPAGPITDLVMVTLQAELQRKGLKRVGRGTIENAIVVVCLRPAGASWPT